MNELELEKREEKADEEELEEDNGSSETSEKAED